MFIVSLKNESASYLLCTCQRLTARLWWKVRTINTKYRWREEMAGANLQRRSKQQRHSRNLHSDSHRWTWRHLQVAIISWHKMLFYSLLLLVHPLTILQFLFFSPIAVPSLISTLQLLYSRCRYSVIQPESIPLPASHTYKSRSSIISHTHI